MSLIKPIILTIPAFNSTSDSYIYFTSVGGDLIVKNRLVIKNNLTNVVVFDDTTTTYSMSHLIPSNTLTNGTNYNATIYTYNNDNEVSQPSNIKSFYCYFTPTLEITNINNGDIINTSNVEISMQYNQIQGERIKSAIINVYNSSNVLVSTSDIMYSNSAPPNIFNFLLSGLESDKEYTIKASGITVNDTEFNSEEVTFSVKYEVNDSYNQVELTNLCDSGCVEIKNNLITIEGETNLSIIKYIDNTKIQLNNSGDYLKWTKGYSFNSNKFTLGLWLNPYQNGEICRIYGDSKDTYYMLKLCKSLPYGESEVKSYIELYGYENGLLKVFKRSNYFSQFNNMTNATIYLRKNENTYTIFVLINSSTDNIITWNGSSNVEYDKITNISYVGESFTQDGQVSEFSNEISNFNITNVVLKNGLYDNIYITSDVEFSMTSTKPSWDYNTILGCDFDNNINGGNIDILLSEVDEIKIKRRKYGTMKWIEIFSKKITQGIDFNFVYYDYFIPSEEKFEYAILPLLQGVEGEYYVSSISSSFNGVFISDINNSYSFYSGISFGDFTDNQSVGQYVPIGSKYPIIVRNSKNDYIQGSCSGDILGKDFNTTRQINRLDVVNERQELTSFLKNGKSKVLKDWNGNIWLIQIIDSPTISFNSSYGMGIASVGFSFVEQGKYDNEDDLIANNMFPSEVS